MCLSCFPGCTSPSSFRCIVDVVLCTGNGSGCFAVECFYTLVAQCSLARLRIKTLCRLCLSSNLRYVLIMVPPSFLLYNPYYLTNGIGIFVFLSGIV